MNNNTNKKVIEKLNECCEECSHFDYCTPSTCICHTPSKQEEKCGHYLHNSKEFICPNCEHNCYCGYVIEKGLDKFCGKCDFNLKRLPSSEKKEVHVLPYSDGTKYKNGKPRIKWIVEINPSSPQPQSWEKEFEQFFPQMCSEYKLKNIPRGVYMDLKSMIKSLLLQAQTEERRRIAEKVIEMWNYPCKCAEKQQICYHNFSIMHSIINLINK